jgi:protein-S-isoprenylcysteine O-methyltransferase Ste14
MENQSYYILVIVCVITHIVRTIYEILKHKNIVTPGKLSFVIIFTNMALLWTSWFTLCSKDTYIVNLPGIINYLGIFLVGLGMVFFLIALLTIKTLETYNGDLMTKGIYSKIRHPMYLGFILWSIGVPVFFGVFYSFILALLFTANILFWRHLEEKELEKRFASYKDYRKTTIF